jgi:hypothetical protein
VKKLVIAVLVVGALPAVALPPHWKEGLLRQYRASQASSQAMPRTGEATAMPRASSERAAKANDAPKARETAHDAR